MQRRKGKKILYETQQILVEIQESPSRKCKRVPEAEKEARI